MPTYASRELHQPHNRAVASPTQPGGGGGGGKKTIFLFFFKILKGKKGKKNKK